MGDMCSNTWIKLESHNLYIAGNLKRQIKYLVENEMILPISLTLHAYSAGEAGASGAGGAEGAEDDASDFAVMPKGSSGIPLSCRSI